MRFKDFTKFLIIKALTIALASLIGLGLLCLVYLLPTDLMLEHIDGTGSMMVSEGGAWPNLHGVEYMKIDNFTDAEYLVLAVTENDGKSLIDKALYNYEYSIENTESPVDVLCDMEAGNRTVYNIGSAKRFWNGYLILLKPLLLFLSYKQLRNLNVIMCMGLVALLLGWFFCHRKYRIYLPFVLLFIFSVNPYVVSKNIFYSINFYITMISGIMALNIYDEDRNETKNDLLFLSVGFCTAFFNMNLSIVLPMGFTLLCALMKNEDYGAKIFAKVTLRGGVNWGIGFFGTYIIKWICLVCHGGFNELTPIIESVCFRTSKNINNDIRVTRVDAILENLYYMLDDKLLIVLFGILTVLYVFLLFVKIIKKRMFIYRCHWLFLIYGSVFLIPFIWSAIFSNHVYIHAWCNFRNFAVSICALGFMMVSYTKQYDD